MNITFQKAEELLHKLKHFSIEITLCVMSILECISIIFQTSTENLTHAFNYVPSSNVDFWNIILIGIIIHVIALHRRGEYMNITFQEVEEFLHKLEHCIIEITLCIMSILKCKSFIFQASIENLTHAFNYVPSSNVDFWNIILIGIIIHAIAFHRLKH